MLHSALANMAIPTTAANLGTAGLSLMTKFLWYSGIHAALVFGGST
jgi:hypothetical protein